MSNIFKYNIDGHEANEEIILKWYTKSKESNECVDKFIYAWISFNALYYSTTEAKGDISSRKEFSQKFEVLGIWNEIKLDNVFFEYIQKRDNKGILDLKEQRTTIIHWTNKEDLCQYLGIIFQIRNNLFHGGKRWDPSDIKLIEGVNKSFLVFLEKLYGFDAN